MKEGIKWCDNNGKTELESCGKVRRIDLTIRMGCGPDEFHSSRWFHDEIHFGPFSISGKGGEALQDNRFEDMDGNSAQVGLDFPEKMVPKLGSISEKAKIYLCPR